MPQAVTAKTDGSRLSPGGRAEVRSCAAPLLLVIPAKAGIHGRCLSHYARKRRRRMDPGFRRDDEQKADRTSRCFCSSFPRKRESMDVAFRAASRNGKADGSRLSPG
ncbi:hypothetical protein SD81_016195 [Tolypothrix campylonemoides VB511288]|nr:hypothetical protein SD81_016195 [Tolypothrix campylonemoides VB511288]